MTYPLRVGLLLISVAALIVGCDRDETAIRTYTAPKDIPAPPQVASADQSPADASTSEQPDQPPITWAVPEGWKQIPGGNAMRFATFAVSSDDPKAQLTVMALPMEAAPLLPNVIRWAGQLKLPNVGEADLPKYVQQTQVSGEQAALVDMTGSADSGKPPTRLLAAIVPHEDKAWFFTLKAPEEVVAGQKANFEKFIQSIQFPAGSAAVPDSKLPDQPGPATDQSFKLAAWKTPAGWEQETAANPMRTVSFRIESGDEKAEVIVTRIPRGTFGSIPDNMNRWRGEVGLDAVDQPKPDDVEKLQLAGGESLLLSFNGPEKQSLVVMDQQGSNYFFIKMLGAKSLVAKQQDAFKQFLDSMKFEPEAR